MNAGVVVLYLNMQQKRFIQVNSACQRLGQLFIHICVCLELISLNTNWQFAWASNIVTLISSFTVDRNERASELASKTKRNKIKKKKPRQLIQLTNHARWDKMHSHSKKQLENGLVFFRAANHFNAGEKFTI